VNYKISKSGSWSWVDFGVSVTESWRDKEPGRAHMQESRNPETQKVQSVKGGASYGVEHFLAFRQPGFQG
jgi:hypothetical protein